jgi:hypothetical protein
VEETLPRLGKKYVIDSDQQGFLPLLNLGERGDRP